MRRPRGFQQRGERRIAAALRIALAAALLAVQVLFVVLTTRYLKDHFALIYGALEGIALITALYIYNKPGDLSYRVAWIIPILFVPVVGLILYLLWGGDTQRKRLQRQTVPKLPPEEPESLRNRSALNADRLQRALPGWSRVSQYLSSRGFYLYQNTKMVYLPEGALLLEDILGRIKAAERFIFMEYFILAEGKLWDRMSAALCERARSGVEVKIIFDDFGNIKRFSAESLQTLRDAGVEVIVFNPVHEYVNRLYFNYRDHRKITVIDGETAYTGGVNIADEYANLIDRFGYWKDSSIRLEGEGVWGLTAAFLNMFSAASCTRSGTTTVLTPRRQRTAFVSRFSTVRRTIPTTPPRIPFCSSSAARAASFISRRRILSPTRISCARCASPATAGWTSG